MSLVSIWVEPWWFAKIVFLATLLFLGAGLPMAIRKRRLGIALTAFPLLVNGAVAYLGMVRVWQVEAFSTAALFAGIAEAERSLLFGACAAVLASLVAAISAWRRPNAEKSNRVWLAIVIVAVAIAAIEPPFALAFTHYASPALLIGASAFLLAAALIGLIASRGASAKPLLFAAACEAAIGAEAWLAMHHFAKIAIQGVP